MSRSPVESVGRSDVNASRGYWITAGSPKLRQYDKLVLRHPYEQPRTWREDRDKLIALVNELYPDASDFQYRGGVLSFRWNTSEGSGEAYESATTPGPVNERFLYEKAQDSSCICGRRDKHVHSTCGDWA